MNALELIERVREHGAEIAREGDRLVLRGTGQPLPDDVRQQVAEHKAELLVALGLPFDQTVAGILATIRPRLAPALAQLSDDKLLALAKWSLITQPTAGGPGSRVVEVVVRLAASVPLGLSIGRARPIDSRSPALVADLG